MKNEPQFRLALESDACTLLRFMREYYIFDGHGFEESKAHVALMPLLRDTNLGCAWLILDGGGAVGYVVLCFGYSLEWMGRDASTSFICGRNIAAAGGDAKRWSL
jgi:hypothetical protein